MEHVAQSASARVVIRRVAAKDGSRLGHEQARTVCGEGIEDRPARSLIKDAMRRS